MEAHAENTTTARCWKEPDVDVVAETSFGNEIASQTMICSARWVKDSALASKSPACTLAVKLPCSPSVPNYSSWF